MRKEEFLEKLEYLLQDVPDGDKEEAISYYRDYLEEAGPEEEEKAVEKFGSPERVAAIIRADLTGNLKDGGAFTDQGYNDERFKDPNFEVVKRLDLPDEKEDQDTKKEEYSQGADHQSYGPYKERYTESRSKTVYTEPAAKPRTSNLLKVILVVLLLIVASPVILGAAGIALGAVAAVLAVAVGIVAAVFSVTTVALIAGVILGAFGVVMMMSAPLDGVFLLGFAFVGIGCGILGIVIMGLLIAAVIRLVPLAWKGFTNLVHFLAGKEKKTK